MTMIPKIPLFPQLPRSEDDLLRWAQAMTRAIQAQYVTLARRVNDLVGQGVTSKRPTADGSERFYFDTTKSILYYDDGAWKEMRVETIATASLPVAAAAQNGRIILEDGGAGAQNIIFYSAGERHRINGGPNV